MTKNLYKGFSITKHVRHKHSVNVLTLLYICSAFLSRASYFLLWWKVSWSCRKV